MTADATRDYLEAISRYPLLSTQQEIQLARKIAQYMELRDKPDPTPAEQRLIKAGLKARATMVNCNLRLVVHIAKRYTGRIKSMDMLDLCQEGKLDDILIQKHLPINLIFVQNLSYQLYQHN
jgi:RNA polymerase primary sigma factor